MCLAVPGQIRVTEGEAEWRTGSVDFGGVTRQLSLACVPEAQVGDWVLAHAGFALSVLDEESARATLEDLDRLAADEGIPRASR